jgi:tetratricopeptide (TPR) repeat protein
MGTTRTDRWGVPLQAGNAHGVPYFDAAVEALLSLSGEPLALAREAVSADPDLVLGHILRAYLSLYGTSAEGVKAAAEILESLPKDIDEREVLHVRAARAWADGQWDDATHWLERALLHDSHDLLALKVAQDLYFLLGQTKDLEGVVRRVIRAWPTDKPGWGYIQGMYAFGLEENQEYAQAEITARAALHLNPSDTWATHALAHVFEMEGRPTEGIAFLTESVSSWSSSYFAIHLWWHLALFHLSLGDLDRALALYDGPIRERASREWIDIVDAASLLWRLSLLDVDVTDRSYELARDIEPLLGDPTYLFNEWHAVMAFGLAGLHDLNDHVIITNHRHSVGTNHAVVEQVGLGLLEGFSSFAAGHLERAIDRLSEAQPLVHLAGGSHAQRDVVALTLRTAVAHAEGARV